MDFEHPYVTVDVLIFSIISDKLSVLLIKRRADPHEGKFAIPGGFVQMDENLDDAAVRVIEKKGEMKNLFLEQLYTFGKVDRDSRGRVVSVAYFALVSPDRVVDASNEEFELIWRPVGEVGELAFDHNQVLNAGLTRLRAKLGYTDVAKGLMPTTFTLTELQKVYEIVLGKGLDKRNFRKKILAADLLIETGEKEVSANRPAKLYKFKILKELVYL